MSKSKTASNPTDINTLEMKLSADSEAHQDSEFERDSVSKSSAIDVSMNDRASSLQGLTDYVRGDQEKDASFKGHDLDSSLKTPDLEASMSDLAKTGDIALSKLVSDEPSELSASDNHVKTLSEVSVNYPEEPLDPVP